MGRDQSIVLRLGHSPDPDDAFMWWPITRDAAGHSPMPTGRYIFEPVLEDIETLNRISEGGASRLGEPCHPLEITAMSCAQYARVSDGYVLTACGSSIGEGYGPKLVSQRAMSADELRDPRVVVAVPGERTSAFAAAAILLGRSGFRHEVVPFDRIIDRVAAGEYDAGLVIHEGQLTYEQHGLHLVVDLGAWWWERFGLPLPLGVNGVRRDLDQCFGQGTIREVAGLLRESVQFALDHREEAVRFALRFARGTPRELADRFVGLYVNAWTLDFGEKGREAVGVFLREAAEAGVVPRGPGDVEIVGSAAGARGHPG